MQLKKIKNCKECYDCIIIMGTNMHNCHANNASMQQNSNDSKTDIFFPLHNIIIHFLHLIFWVKYELDVFSWDVGLSCVRIIRRRLLLTHHQLLAGTQPDIDSHLSLATTHSLSLLGVCTVTLGGKKSNEWDVKLCLVA